MADSQRIRAPLDRARWSFLVVVAVGVAVTIAVKLGRLPTGARGYANRGVADMEEGRYEAAIENLDRAIAMDQAYADARIARANVWTRDGHPYRALVDADAALKLDAGAAKAKYIRGVALRQLGRYDAALQSFNEALNDDPTLGKASLARANLLFDIGRLDNALTGYGIVWRFRQVDETFFVAPLLIWATETLLGNGDRAGAELAERVRGSLPDRARLASFVAEAKGEAPAATNDRESAAVRSWIDAVRSLAKGRRTEAIEELRAAVSTSPPESWVRERSRSMLEIVTVGLRIQPDNPDLSSSLSFGPGLAIGWVRKDGAAAAAGLTTADRLVRVADAAASSEALSAIVAKAAPGSEIALELDRGGTPVRATIVVGGGTALTPASSSPTR